MSGATRPEGDRIYRVIRWLMIADMVVGSGLVLLGLSAGVPEIVPVGAGLAIIGGALFLFFRGLARRAARETDRRP